MHKRIRNIGILLLVFLWVALTAFAWFAPSKDISLWERRPLQKMPSITENSLLNGSFMKKFESYSLDQFPLRDSFRTLKSLFAYNILQQSDNNGIYMENGYAAKLEYPLNSVSVSHAMKRFQFVYEQYLKESGSKIYMTVIPDKGYYLAAENGYPAMDYEKLFATVKDATPWAQTVDITGDLTISDYYRTDTHWRQEKLLKVAERIADAMGVTVGAVTPTVATQEFYGVYYGQAALPMKPDELILLENDILEDCRVYNHETGEYGSVYDQKKLAGTDPYEVYLSGSQALLVIENPKATTQRELIIFRDSFASALAPLLVQDYKTVTLVDTRYISPDLLGEYLTFHGQDVLFAYSTLILNNSATLK